MKLSTVQASLARKALATLENDDAFAHPMSTIARVLGEAGASEVRQREAEYQQFNKDLAGDTALLSPDAAAYWADWQKMYRSGQRFHAAGSGTTYPKWEKAVSRMCEALDESFDARVPDNEKEKFLIYDAQRMDAGNWDDRWHACVDFFPPVLRRELLGDGRVSNPKGRAQREVLNGLLNPVSAPPVATPSASSARLRKLVQRLDQ